MASEEDLLGNEYKDLEDLEELDADAEEALLAPSDEDDAGMGEHNITYGENEAILEEDRSKISVYGVHVEDDVLDLEPDGDPEFETLSENTSKVFQNEEDELVVERSTTCEEEFQETEITYTEENEELEDKNESSESEDENENGRGKFRRERLNIISLASAKQRNDIPDTLDAIINTESVNITPKHGNTKPNATRKPWMGIKNRSSANNEGMTDRWRGQNLTFKTRPFARMQTNQGNRGRNQSIGRVQYQNEINPIILANDISRFSHQNKNLAEQQTAGSRNIHINPKFAQSVPCSREGTHPHIQNCDRPFADVSAVRQETFRPSFPITNRQNIFTDNRRQSVSNKPLVQGPRPYLLENPPSFPFGSDTVRFPLNQSHMPQPRHIPPQSHASLIPNVNLPIQNHPVRSNFTPMSCTPSDVYHPPLMAVNPQRPSGFTHGMPNNEQSLFQERYNFNENMNNWKQIPVERAPTNNFCQFQSPVISSRENTNLMGNTNMQPQPFIQNSSVASYSWQNPPPTQNNFPESQQQQQQQQQQQPLLQQNLNALPFPNLQIRPDIQQKICLSQPFQTKPQQSLGIPSFDKMKGNIKSNSLRNKSLSGNVGSVLTIIKPLSEQQLKQVNAIKPKQRMTTLKELRNISTVRKRPPQDAFPQLPIKQIKIEKSIMGKNQKQNKSNIKEIKLLETLPKETEDILSDSNASKPSQKSTSQSIIPEISPPVPKSTLPPEDEEDEETRILREKIEEQKKKREEFLKCKERRRQLMAEQRRKELEKRNLNSNSATPAETNTSVTTVKTTTKLSVKQRLQTSPFPALKNQVLLNVSNPLINTSQSTLNQNLKTVRQFPKEPSQNSNDNQPSKKFVFFQKPRIQGNTLAGQINLLRKKYNINFPQKKNFQNIVSKNFPKSNFQGQQKNINVLPVKQLSTSNVVISPGIQNNSVLSAPQNMKFINNLSSALQQIRPAFNAAVRNFEGKPIQSPYVNRIPVSCGAHGRGQLFKPSAVSEFHQQRTVGLISNSSQQAVLAQKINQLHPLQIKQQQMNTSFGPRLSKPNTNISVIHRKIITKNTCRMVIIENLAASTSEPQIMKMCEGIGIVESIDYNRNERKAAVKFQNPEDAEEFKKKFQRRMIDLSLINVTLLPA